MRKKVRQVIMTLIFVLVILGTAIINIIIPSKDFSETENRPLQQLPDFSFQDLFSGVFGMDFEKYTTDQFIARDSWIEIKNNSDYLLQKRDSNSVYFGKDGYLFEKLTENTLNKEQLKINMDRVKTFSDKYSQILGDDNVKVMIVPNSFEILSDKLPEFAPTVDESFYLEQIQNSIGDNFINLIDVFIQNKNNVDLFYKTDHHWTSDGAFIAYQEWCKSMNIKPMSIQDFDISVVSDDFYGTYYSKARYIGVLKDQIKKYTPKQDFEYSVDYDLGQKQTDTLYNESYLEKKDKYSYFLDSNHSVVNIKTNVDNDEKLLIIKDSYANSFVPFAVNHFSQVYVVDLRYYRDKISTFIEQNGITDTLVLYNFSSFTTDSNTGAMIL